MPDSTISKTDQAAQAGSQLFEVVARIFRLFAFGGLMIGLVAPEAAVSQTARTPVPAAQPGIYFDISRCHACAYDNWHGEVTAALARDGLRAFPGSTTVVNQNVTGIVRKASAGEWFDSVFVGPYLSEPDAQGVTNRLAATLGSISKRHGERTDLERVQPYIFKVGDFEVVTRDLRSPAQRQAESVRTAQQGQQTGPGCSFVTAVEVTVMLGMGSTTKGNCDYTSRDGLRTFSIGTASTNILNQNAAQIFAEERNLMGSMRGLLRDEPILGPSAFSCVWFDLEGGRGSAFVVLKGARVLITIMAEKQPGNRELTTQFVDRLRPIVKRVLLGL